MEYKPENHNEKSIRLKGYDYSQTELYFITICTQGKECLFGNIQNGEMILNNAGKMIEFMWSKITDHFTNTRLHEFIVMPNHFHGILEITTGALVDNLKPIDAHIPMNVNKTRNRYLMKNIQSDIEESNMRELDIGNLSIKQSQGVAPTKEIRQEINPAKKTIEDVIRAFKSITNVEYIRGVKKWKWKEFHNKLWQRNYYERIIPNQQAYEIISNYIINNPSTWYYDKFQRWSPD